MMHPILLPLLDARIAQLERQQHIRAQIRPYLPPVQPRTQEQVYDAVFEQHIPKPAGWPAFKLDSAERALDAVNDVIRRARKIA